MGIESTELLKITKGGFFETFTISFGGWIQSQIKILLIRRLRRHLLRWRRQGALEKASDAFPFSPRIILTQMGKNDIIL